MISAVAVLPGCRFFGMAIQAHRLNGNKEVPAEYSGLQGKTFAVFVAADRVIQAESPGLVTRLTIAISRRIAEHADAAGIVPPATVLDYQFNNPKWPAMAPVALAETLGIERLVLVDIMEYRLNEPGNSYIWGGAFTGRASVIEADGPIAEEPAFEKDIAVSFPDGAGYGQGDFNKRQIESVLTKRFVDRTTWLFYTHDEPYYPKY